MMTDAQKTSTVIDSHSHLQDRKYSTDVDQVINRALEGGVEMMVCVGYDLDSSRAALELARKYGEIRAVVGIHPHDADSLNELVLAELWDMASDPRVVAFGEMGLDYFRNLSPADDQRRAFRAQIKMAREMGKPIVIHDRDAHAEVLAIIKEEKAGVNGGVMHCYSGHLPLAEELMREGFMISFAGPLTYTNAKKTVEVAARLPLDRMLIETDCPYLAPQAYRGQRNEPLRVWEVAKKLAEIQQKSLEEVAAATSLNTRRVFHI